MSPFRDPAGSDKKCGRIDRVLLHTLPRPRVGPALSGEERSLYAGRTFAAGLTAEAAVVSSLFFLCLYLFWVLFPVMQLQTNLQNALEETGGRIAVSAPLLQMTEAGERIDGTEDLPAGILKDAVFAAYAKTQVLKRTDGSLWKAARVKGASRGLSMAGSSFSTDGDVFLQASYKIRLPGLAGELFTIPLCQTSRRKCWTGRSDPGTGGPQDGEAHILVYIADNGSVYHKDPGCYHLNVTVRSVSAASVGAARNNGGGRYRPCEHCAAAADIPGTVFITPEGDRYHVTRDCSGLKRSLKSVPLAECSLPPCSNCGR